MPKPTYKPGTDNVPAGNYKEIGPKGGNVPKDEEILSALQEANCIEIKYADNTIRFIRRGEKPYLYLVERSELLVNRIISFILGIASTLIVEAAIKILFSAQ